jgi:hypothetical protein
VSRARLISYKLFGEPPPKGAARVEVLRWLRRFYLRMLPFVLVLWVFAIAWWPGVLLLAVLGVTTLIGLQGLASLNMRIRREERR